MADITALGSLSVLTIFTIILVCFLITRYDYKSLSYLGFIVLGCLIIPYLMKLSFNRERPNLEEHLTSVFTSSFPSGHSFAGTSMYFALAFLASGSYKSLKVEIVFYFSALVVVSLVAVSRLYLGVHYPSDII